MSDDQGAQLMSSVAGVLCSGAEHTLLAPWSGGATDQALVEDQVSRVQPLLGISCCLLSISLNLFIQLQTLSHMGSGALENDITCLVRWVFKSVSPRSNFRSSLYSCDWILCALEILNNV